jgi:hypothetical protein
MSANDMKRGSHDDDFGEEGFTDWVRLKGCILGDDRAENLMTDTLSSLGVSDRNDIELLGVSASKASIVNRAASAGGAEGAAASGEGGDNESSRHAGGRITDNNSVGPGSSSASSANGSYLAQKEGESKATEGEGKESEAWSDVDNDEGPKVQISNLEIAVFQKIGTAETMSFPCAVLLTCHNINIRPSLFHALNDSGLAYDGRLVVQPQSMQTSDPFIFAGGDITKFSRKYAHLSHDHCYFSNFDIGQYLADKFSTFVDPLLAYANSVSSSSASPPGPGSLTSTSANNDNNRAAAASISSSMQPQNNNHNNPTTNILVDVSSEVPIFKKPRTVSCCIPGGYHARSLMASAVDPKMVVKEKDGQVS